MLTEPDDKTCTVSNGTGTISGANVTDVSVVCGGTVSLKLVRLDETKLDVAATPIPLRVQVEATFSEAVDTASVESAFSLKDDQDADVDGSFSWNAAGTVMTFTPSSHLAHATIYEIAITSTATSEHFTTMTNGDINGDGYDDIIIGYAPFISTGQAYVYSGATLTLSGNTSITAPTDALATITGAAAGDRLGRSVSGAGDVNDDGFDDIVVGADYAGGDAKGQAYVYSGATLSGGITAPTSALATITGAELGDCLGGIVSGAGDVNGDSHDDIIVDARGAFASHGGGQVYVYSGAMLSGNMTAPTDALATITGVACCNEFGNPVSGTGDINGDGYGDVIIGAPDMTAGGFIANGQAYVYSGATLTLSGNINITAPTNALATITGVADNDFVGSSVSGAGDIDGDGYDDIIVGSDQLYGNGKGQAYVYSGETLTLSGNINITPPEDALATITGAANGDFLGNSVSGASY